MLRNQDKPWSDTGTDQFPDRPAGALLARSGRPGRVGLGAAVPAVPAGEDLAGVPQMAAVEVGEERVEEDELGVRGLPDQEVRRALLAGGPDEQVDVGDAGLVQVAGEHLLVDPVGPQLSR